MFPVIIIHKNNSWYLYSYNEHVVSYVKQYVFKHIHITLKTIFINYNILKNEYTLDQTIWYYPVPSAKSVASSSNVIWSMVGLWSKTQSNYYIKYTHIDMEIYLHNYVNFSNMNQLKRISIVLIKISMLYFNYSKKM